MYKPWLYPKFNRCMDSYEENHNYPLESLSFNNLSGIHLPKP